MSMCRLENYGNYVITETQPDWMKAERYDYCEPFVENKKGKKKHVLAQLFLSMFF